MISKEEEFNKLVDSEKYVMVYSGDSALPASIGKQIGDDKRFKLVQARGDFLGTIKNEMEVTGDFLLVFKDGEPHEVLEVTPQTTDIKSFLKSIP